MSLFLVIIILLVLWVFFLVFFLWKKKKLWEGRRKYFLQILSKVKKNSSSKSKIIDYDKLYHNILKDIWYKWTFWEILKSNPKVIININKIWELHKLRNKLVHEFDEHESLDSKAIEYEKEIKNLFNDVK